MEVELRVKVKADPNTPAACVNDIVHGIMTTLNNIGHSIDTLKSRVTVESIRYNEEN